MEGNLNTGVLVLAAGKGTRMKSSLPKVMQPLLEEPMISYCLRTLSPVGPVATVLGYEGEVVEQYLSSEWPDVQVIWQREQLGTGHAVMMAKSWLKSLDKVLIVNGDMPLLTEKVIEPLLEVHNEGCSFLSMELDNPAGYGRVIRDSLINIVEDKDCSEEQKKIKEVNAGLYLVDVPPLLVALDKIDDNNAQNEYYLVDVIRILQEMGMSVSPVRSSHVDHLSGVNDPIDLAIAGKILRDRQLHRWMKNGVKCIDPSSVWIGPKVTFKGEATLYPNVQLWGNTSIGDRAAIGSFSILRNATIEDDVVVNGYAYIDESSFRSGSKAGPFCYVRQKAVIDEKGFAGKFVEIKKSHIGKGSKVPHLSYMGDATLGSGVNIGAGTITCNYDGVKKHPTSIGDECFVGSDTMLVAPVSLGDRSMTGAGSVITKNVPDDALAIGRARQKTIGNWRKKTKMEGK